MTLRGGVHKSLLAALHRAFRDDRSVRKAEREVIKILELVQKICRLLQILLGSRKRWIPRDEELCHVETFRQRLREELRIDEHRNLISKSMRVCIS